MELLEQIKENAKKQCKTIVLPEGTEELNRPFFCTFRENNCFTLFFGIFFDLF